ncbi:methionyl-tRNA formyltransferase [Camelliibacillus cellulosilyticus]|uniref:Methionyl-tRNA formyltransferase n=1 Tax=Camelliibacillus cellulosilyticus TaxID=2174486 RepID=A0ABV9GHA8_9BACL
MNVLFMGTPDFAVPVLKQLIDDGYQIAAVITQPDRPKGRKRVLTPPPVKVLAEQIGLPVLQPNKIRSGAAVSEALGYKPDLIVTCAYGQILPEALLNAPQYGAINVHASLLPEYRGAAPIQQAIMDGKSETGVTIMYMVKALDAGDIISQVKVPIDRTDNAGTLHDKLSVAGAKLLSKTLPDLIAGKITPIPQDETQATYVSTLKREDEQIDWDKPGEAVFNHIRALAPVPGAFTLYNGQVLKIFDVEQRVGTDSEGRPGTILAVDAESFYVKTGDHVAIKVNSCQPAGKKRLRTSDFLRGTAIKEGDVLGG